MPHEGENLDMFTLLYYGNEIKALSICHYKKAVILDSCKSDKLFTEREGLAMECTLTVYLKLNNFA